MSVEEDTELRDLVAQTLEKNGVLNKIRAELRANVFLALEEQDSVKQGNVSNKALKIFLGTKAGHEAFSLVREFLQFFNLDFTLAVFEPESDYIGKASSRENLKNELNLTKCDSNNPLLVEFMNKKSEGFKSPPPNKKSVSKIPQLIHDSSHNTIDAHKTKEVTVDKRVLSPDNFDDDNEDELLKELGVSPISLYSNEEKNSKPSWLNSEPLGKPLERASKAEQNDLTPITNLGSLKDAPPVPGVGGFMQLNKSNSGVNTTSPDLDDIMKIDEKINELGFEIPKYDSSYKEKRSKKDTLYNYDDDFTVSSSEKSERLSITEEIEGDLSIGSFAGSKADDFLTTDQTVSQMSVGFDFGEDAEF